MTSCRSTSGMRADEARDGARDRRLGQRRPEHPRALEVRLRGLPRQLRQRGAGEARRARGEPQGDGRRRGDPVPEPPAGDRQLGGPRTPRAPRARAERAHRGAPEPALPPLRAGRSPGDRAARCPELHRALPRLPVSARLARRAVPAVPRLDRAALGGRRQPLLPQPRRPRARRDRALRRRAGLARTDLGLGVPEGADGAGARGDARRSRRRPPRAAERRARSRGSPEQDAARVLRRRSRSPSASSS